MSFGFEVHNDNDVIQFSTNHRNLSVIHQQNYTSGSYVLPHSSQVLPMLAAKLTIGSSIQNIFVNSTEARFTVDGSCDVALNGIVPLSAPGGWGLALYLSDDTVAYASTNPILSITSKYVWYGTWFDREPVFNDFSTWTVDNFTVQTRDADAYLVINSLDTLYNNWAFQGKQIQQQIRRPRLTRVSTDTFNVSAVFMGTSIVTSDRIQYITNGNIVYAGVLK